MKHVKKFEDVYYEPEPETTGSWQERVKGMLDDFTSQYVDECMGSDLGDFWVEVKPHRILISVHYVKEERSFRTLFNTGTNKDEMKSEWKMMMDDMIEKLKREFDYDFIQHNLNENGYMIEV